MDPKVDMQSIKDINVHDLSVAELKSLKERLSEQYQFIQEENTRYAKLFSQLNVLNDDGLLPTNIGQLLSDINYAGPLSSGHNDKLKKHKKYLLLLNICIKMYVNLNKKMEREIKNVKWELEESITKINRISSINSEDLNEFRLKVKKYEAELLKFEKSNPWLKDPSFNLPDISKEIFNLENLRYEAESLRKELNVYQGLKPDIKEATLQLETIKLKNEEMSSKFLNGQK